ncbi:MAG TPA: radical SAM protein [Patescibacteria group bacterium]|nr:radical SAM protein [Patescibacteria group bacterium]
MNVLLVRPDPGNERFGLGPFFRVEPLGLEYVAAAVRARGAAVTLVDERFARRGGAWIGRARAGLVGLACMHALEYDRVRELARAVRRRSPGSFIAVGGHAAAACPGPLESPEIDAVCTDDGETVFPMLADALDAGRPLAGVPGLRLRTPEGWIGTAPLADRADLDDVAAPARDLVARYQARYHCLLFKPVWCVETARGCPFRCSFCSVWSLYDRSFRERSIGAVVDDLASVGENVFIVDDLFWNHTERSLELARALARRGVRKRWILVQSRADLVRRHPELLEAWRPLARDFDVFIGFEAPSDEGLDHLTKDATVGDTIEAARVARALKYGVTGNFVVDPGWEEADFLRLWEFVATHRLERSGFTILTPLPGTDLHRDHPRLRRDAPWQQYDMHHALWEPRLGARRFFELYAETWRRSILNLQGKKRWTDWARQVRPAQIPYLTRVLLRTQRLMRPEAYLAEHGAAWTGAPGSTGGFMLRAGRQARAPRAPRI